MISPSSAGGGKCAKLVGRLEGTEEPQADVGATGEDADGRAIAGVASGVDRDGGDGVVGTGRAIDGECLGVVMGVDVPDGGCVIGGGGVCLPVGVANER